MEINKTCLDDFIAQVDKLGGPSTLACAAYWGNFHYSPSFIVDHSLDPWSLEYFEQQLTLYNEISGRKLDQTNYELTEFDLQRHIHSANPYDHQEPSGLAKHLLVLANVCASSFVQKGAKALDMGCGWGLSSELLAYCGLDVVAVDINQSFVDLVNTRAKNKNLNITAVRASFDEYTAPDEAFELILFYECLHHATRPWEVLKKMARILSKQGQLFMATEPVQSIWWKHWGLRLDPLSVYCIRKFGWFESGWSEDFLCEMVCRAGLFFFPVANPTVPESLTFRGIKQSSFTAKELSINASHDDGWYLEEKYLVSKGHSGLRMSVPLQCKRISIDIANFRPKSISLEIRINGSEKFIHVLDLGANLILIEAVTQIHHIEFISDVWIPSKEIGNVDHRKLSFHLEKISFK